jgi:undecaprenyl-diphosphatase
VSFIVAIILGIVQGLTEFLPVSSSGHLALAQHLIPGFDVEEVGVVFDLLLHVATLMAVLIYFRKRLLSLLGAVFDKSRTEERRLIFLLFISTLPIVAVGFLFKDQVEGVKNHPVVVSALLCVTGLVLFIPGWLKSRADGDHSPRSAIIMGIGQAFALLPGISRSGTTIAAGMLAGVRPSLAAEFSFLLAIPAIGGAMVLKMKDLSSIPTDQLAPYAAGMVAAFITGLLAIYAVLAVVRRGKFAYFGFYCLAVGIGGLIYFSIRAQ